MASPWGTAPVAKSVLGPKLPAPFPNRTETVFAPVLTVTRSGFPSPFTSAMPTVIGRAPVGKLTAGLKDAGVCADDGRAAPARSATRVPAMSSMQP